MPRDAAAAATTAAMSDMNATGILTLTYCTLQKKPATDVNELIGSVCQMMNDSSE